MAGDELAEVIPADADILINPESCVPCQLTIGALRRVVSRS